MYAFVKQMCQAFPGCALANPTQSKSSELIYNFPIEAPFLVMHFNTYAAGTYAGFEGSECYLVGCCGMSSFACMEPITNVSAATFASAIMKMLVQYGLCHTLCSIRTLSALAYAARHWIYYKSINTSCLERITTQCLSSESIVISQKA
jgi:hypothetical protein